MPTANAGFNDLNDTSGGELLADLGPVLYVHIGFDRAYQDDSQGRPNISDVPLPALVDTGAEVSCIDSILAERLGLPIADSQSMAGAHGVAEVNVYLAQIYVSDLDFVINGNFPAVDLAAGGEQYFALLGRDFLRNFTMIYEGETGQVRISTD